MVKWVIILLIFVSVGPHKSYADDSVKCISAPSEEEVFKLLSFVKNNVLGTVPKFCREEGPSQLSDQVDDSEKDLSDFVSALKVIGPNEKNMSKLTKGNFDETVVQTAKFIILKKIWAQSSESIQYDLLISKDCGSLGLNRFPIHEKNKKVNKNESKVAYQKAIAVCKSDKIEDIAPYLSKDVLAETLLNLRRIFPEDFPRIVVSMCDGIKKTDEALLKNDAYEDLLISDSPISAKNFSLWLQGLYQKYQPIEETFTPPTQIEGDPAEIIIYWKTEFDKRQDNLRRVYESLLKNDETLVQDKWEASKILEKVKKGDITIEKNPKDIYIVKKLSAENKESVDNSLKKFEEKLILAYEKAQIQNQTPAVPLKEVPLKSGSAVLISKDQDGKLKYSITEKDRQIILEKAKQEKIFLDTRENNNFKSSYYQAISKVKFDLQERQEGDELNKPTIQKTADGLYKAAPTEDAILGTKIYENFIEKFGGDIVPDPNGSDNYLVKVDGEVVLVGYNKILHQSILEYEADQKIAKGSTLNGVLKETYQRNSSDSTKIKNLPPEKIKALKEYTASGFSSINGCLRKRNCDQTQRQKTANIMEVLYKVKVDNKDPKILYRGSASLPPDVSEALKNNPKNFILDNAFLSTSADLKTAQSFSKTRGKTKGFLFIIKAKSCVGIADISSVEFEDEFLCPPGMRFNVKKQSESEDTNTYVLEEVK